MSVPAGANGQTMQEGRWYCLGCDAEIVPTGPRQSEGHFAVRFGPEDRYNYAVYEGEAKRAWAYEVQAGPGGWIIEAEAPIRACADCGSFMRVHVRFGDDFRVAREQG